MKLKFESLEIENFGSFRKAQVVRLDRPPGLYFMRGKNVAQPRLGGNGCGKSTVWRALVWILFGKTPNGLKNPDLQPWNGMKGSLGCVMLTIGDFKASIVRCSNPNEIALNDTLVTQDAIDKLLGMSMELFCNSILLPQGEALFLDMKPSAKLQMLTDALTLERWEERSVKAGKLTAGFEREHSTLTGELASLQRNEEHFKKLLTEARARSTEWENDRKNRIEIVASTKRELETRLKAVQDTLGEAQLKLDGAGTELKALEPQVDKMRTELDDAINKVTNAANEMRNMTSHGEKLVLELVSLGDGKGCPTCGQSIKGTNFAKYQAKLENEIKEVEEQVRVYPIDSLRKIMEDIKSRYKNLTTSAERFRNVQDTMQTTVNLYGPKEATLLTEIRVLNERSTEHEKEDNPHTESVHQLRRSVSKAEGDIESCTKDIAAVLRDVELNKFWVKGFKDVTLYILEEVLQEVELACNSMLPEVGLEGWEMQFSVERETQSGSVQRGLTVTVLSPDNPKPVRWECWSGGEAQRLRVIGALAVSEVLLNYAGITSNLEVLDEPTQHLSTEGTDDLCVFLAARAKQLDLQTWWVDHTVVESALFSKVVTIVKDKDGSRVEEAA